MGHFLGDRPGESDSSTDTLILLMGKFLGKHSGGSDSSTDNRSGLALFAAIFAEIKLDVSETLVGTSLAGLVGMWMARLRMVGPLLFGLAVNNKALCGWTATASEHTLLC